MFEDVDGYMPFKIIILDDHLMFAQGIGELLKKQSPKWETSYFSKIDKVKIELLKNEYHFLVSDILIPNSNVKEFILYCRKVFPKMIIIMLSGITDMHVVKDYFSMGIKGYLSKVVGYQELVTALQQTYQGDYHISSDLSGRLATSFFIHKESGLTKKELELLRIIAAGNTVDKSAALLHISRYTVLAHRRNIMSKLNLHSAAELVKYAFENNLQ